MAKVVYEHVTKRFGDVIAVNDLSLEIEDREFLVLVGPSGCGKSTVIRLLAGLETLTSGSIYLGDRLVNDVPVRDRDIAMVFQSYALYPHMTVFDNMAFGLRMHGASKESIHRRVQDAAEALGIEDLLKRRPAQLSGGQRQRVALGRAIVREPQVFLFDEPLSNLDAKLRVQTRTEISKLHQRLGTTFIYVTHDQVEAMTMATRIAVLKDGLLHQVGTPEELYFQPDNLFVAGFIGSPAMNFVPGVLKGTAEQMTLDAGSLQIAFSPQRSQHLAAQAGTEVQLGIRPEDIYASDLVPAHVNGAQVAAHVDVTEMLGSETLLHIDIDQHRLLAKVDPRTRARAGEALQVTLDVDRLHLFDAQTEKAIDKIEVPAELREAAAARLPTLAPEVVSPA
ncbi:MAG TPA: sn-glycerol-3-phosphate ABC transporter ATP-binding protein UgpC [Dehalococcoidia bacterium]|nr:sn-glycerol-3-phosphate ABC transporter ATP-binding protein UgpC [Dehalococcoidia bacterium]